MDFKNDLKEIKQRYINPEQVIINGDLLIGTGGIPILE